MKPSAQSVAVIGAGVVGLTTAVRLLQAGKSVTVYAAARTPGTTSDRAGAVFTPTKSGEDARIAAWTARSFEVLRGFAEQGAAAPVRGVRMGLSREFFLKPKPEQPWWRGMAAEYRRLTGLHASHADGYEIVVPRMDITRYIPSLEAWAASLGAAFVEGRVARFEDLFARGHEVVVNCSGLGARELAGDARMFPMRGQIVAAPNDIGLDVALHEEVDSRTEATYLFPFQDHIVLGGTYEERVGEPETSEAALAAVVERCRGLLRKLEIPGADRLARTRLRQWAGLRPARVVDGNPEAVRLEMERVGGGVVVHNYGHGRAGITLAWGCAEEAARLAGG